MNIQIIGDNFDVSENTRKMVDEKVGIRLDKLLTNFAPEMKSALMRIQKDKFEKYSVNLDLNLPGKEHVYAETSHVNLESALIDLEQQAEKQIKRYREEVSNYSLG
jgi:ribosomal subunit interface protein